MAVNVTDPIPVAYVVVYSLCRTGTQIEPPDHCWDIEYLGPGAD